MKTDPKRADPAMLKLVGVLDRLWPGTLAKLSEEDLASLGDYTETDVLSLINNYLEFLYSSWIKRPPWDLIYVKFNWLDKEIVDKLVWLLNVPVEQLLELKKRLNAYIKELNREIKQLSGVIGQLEGKSVDLYSLKREKQAANLVKDIIDEISKKKFRQFGIDKPKKLPFWNIVIPAALVVLKAECRLKRIPLRTQTKAHETIAELVNILHPALPKKTPADIKSTENRALRNKKTRQAIAELVETLYPTIRKGKTPVKSR